MHRFLLLGFLMLPTQAGALDLAGRYGFAGEWEVSATLIEAAPGSWRSRDFSGPLRMKHLAMCGPGEVSEKSGALKLSRLGRTRYSASLTLGGEECSVSGTLSQDEVAFARCGAQGQIPLRLWVK
ncbi:hypothetical protein DWF00_18410 [Bosea caraganae]|uniref:DUF3617 family protein n=1 Tax=Bosea caraganae TaxID=2763117 RepID=A0A370L7Z1_9HYPH|nr:hypothetical protein [Bosea caraganae]RDJ25159.1 hypothetical protein DWF00_18410 [Bosea caraganae]RDJ26269.1 hypothetical protein DWE98_10630 [Bosea caraganae]